MAVQRRGISGLNDPAVDEHFGVGRLNNVVTPEEDPVYGAMAMRRAAARNQTDAQRKKAARDRKRNKVTFDLPENQTEFIAEMAALHQCPPSHVAALLLEFAIRRWGEVDIESRKVRTRNLRFEWFLDV